jgi:phosphoglycolate phosphatase
MGFQLACVTNKPEEFTHPLLERLGLAGDFAVVVGGDTLPHKKPHPEPIRHACRVLGVAPHDNVHVGDSLNDALAARAAGSAALCVPYGYTEEGPVDSAECDGLVSDLVAVAAWLAAANRARQAGHATLAGPGLSANHPTKSIS